ncbi:MAG: hypothetical protein ACRDTJ_09800 [Pseudonocardiaceae bacterium]
MSKTYLADALTEYVETVVIDRLGPATPETRAEVKRDRRTQQRKALREWATFYAAMLVGFVLIGAGSVVGNRLDVEVTDLWKFVPSLSGERAEPEESAR